MGQIVVNSFLYDYRDLILIVKQFGCFQLTRTNWTIIILETNLHIQIISKLAITQIAAIYMKEKTV